MRALNRLAAAVTVAAAAALLMAQVSVVPSRQNSSGPATTTLNGIGATSTTGLNLINATDAAAGAQQYSPRLCWTGQGWKTTATAASQTVAFCYEARPVQGTTVPTGNFVLSSIVNGVVVDIATTSQNGAFRAAGGGASLGISGALGIYAPSDGVATLYNSGGSDFGRIQFGGTSSSFPALKRNAAGIDVRLADDSGYATLAASQLSISGTKIFLAGVQTFIAATPTISSGFGTSPSVTAGGDIAFRLNVGTGGSASTGVIAMNTTNTTGWNCFVSDLANTATNETVQTASTTTTVSVASYSRTTGAALAWPSGAVIAVSCIGF